MDDKKASLCKHFNWTSARKNGRACLKNPDCPTRCLPFFYNYPCPSYKIAESHLTEYDLELGYCELAQTYCSVAESHYKQGKEDMINLILNAVYETENEEANDLIHNYQLFIKNLLDN